MRKHVHLDSITGFVSTVRFSCLSARIFHVHVSLFILLFVIIARQSLFLTLLHVLYVCVTMLFNQYSILNTTCILLRRWVATLKLSCYNSLTCSTYYRWRNYQQILNVYVGCHFTVVSELTDCIVQSWRKNEPPSIPRWRPLIGRQWWTKQQRLAM